MSKAQVFFVWETHPARSTRWNLARLMVAEPVSRAVTWIVKIQCERDEAWFIGVWKDKAHMVVTRTVKIQKFDSLVSGNTVVTWTVKIQMHDSLVSGKTTHTSTHGGDMNSETTEALFTGVWKHCGGMNSHNTEAWFTGAWKDNS